MHTRCVRASVPDSRRPAPLARHDAAAAMLDHVLELVPVMLHEALHRPGGGIPKGADGVTLDLVGHIHQHVQIVLAALAGEDSLDEAIHPASTLAARRALPAGLGVVEARDALQYAYHAGGLVHHDHRTRAEC